jgi:hypothetical protein
MGFIIDFSQFRVAIGTKCGTLTRCINVTYVVGHEQVVFFSVYRVYSVNTDNILMWIVKCSILYKEDGL